MSVGRKEKSKGDGRSETYGRKVTSSLHGTINPQCHRQRWQSRSALAAPKRLVASQTLPLAHLLIVGEDPQRLVDSLRHEPGLLGQRRPLRRRLAVLLALRGHRRQAVPQLRQRHVGPIVEGRGVYDVFGLADLVGDAPEGLSEVGPNEDKRRIPRTPVRELV